MADSIQKQYPGASVELIPGGGGDFIVIGDGELLWDKRNRDGDFPEHEAIVARLA